MAKAKKQAPPKKKPVAKKPAAKKPAAKQPAAKQPAAKPAAKKSAPPASSGPNLFRLNVEVGDLDEAEKLYNALLETTGRRQAGSRIYYGCGGVTIQMVAVEQPHPVPKALYFLVDDLEAAFARARDLDVLSFDLVHGKPGGEITVWPWGERSFYCDDPWQNTICFVQTGTTYPG